MTKIKKHIVILSALLCLLTLRTSAQTIISTDTTVCDTFYWEQFDTVLRSDTNIIRTVEEITYNLTLHIQKSQTYSHCDSVCDSFTWAYDNKIYLHDTILVSLKKEGVCNNSDTLHLTILHGDTTTINQKGCDSLRWEENNSTYYTSTTDSIRLQNTDHCDSIIVLDLTINNTTSNLRQETMCDSFYYDIADTTFYASTTYIDTLLHGNRKECDSIRTLSLKINYSSAAPPLDTIYCDSFYLTSTQKTYYHNGAYSDTIKNSKNCDSIISLNLTLYKTPHLTATADTILHQCNTLTLTAHGADFYIWQRDNTLSKIYDSITIASPQASTIYNVTGYNLGEDLCVNGDFTMGNTGFRSNYQYFDITNDNEGQYTIGDNAHRYNTNFYSIYDHTRQNVTGKYMIVNGKDTPGTTVWKQTVNVKPGNKYLFRCYATNIDNLHSGEPARLQFSINGTLIDTAFTLEEQCGQWVEYHCVWDNAIATQADIAIINQNSQPGGNDFGLDDIGLIPLSCPDSKEIHVGIRRDTTYATECNAYTWAENNMTYSTAGCHNVHRTTVSGCDSILTLNLTLGNTSTTYTKDSACQQYTWAFNRKTYTSSNRYYDTIPNANGCYDYGILDLIIQNCVFVDYPDNIDTSRCMMMQPTRNWSIQNSWSSNAIVSNLNIPMVGDLDDDGIPDIVCFGNNGECDNNGYMVNRILVFDGVTKQLKNNILMPGYVSAYDAGSYGLVKLPNRKGLIVVACTDLYLRAFDISSATPNIPIWTSNATYNTNRQYAANVSFADFNNDGNPEIAVSNKIFDAATGLLLATATGGSNYGASYSHYSHRTGRKLNSPSVANILGDDKQELILGNEIYNVEINNQNGTAGNSITLVKRIAPPAGVVEDGHAQVCDFNLDGHLDVFISNKSTSGTGGKVSMYVWDVANNKVSQAVDIPCNMSGKSIPLIADMDGDNNLEITIQCAASGVGNNRVRTYKFNAATEQFEFMWGFPVDEDSYSNGVTAFDFNLDGANEMLICDQSTMRVVDGMGNVTNSFGFSEITIMQYPVIADVDNDGHAEVVSVGSNKLNIFKSNGQPWAPARSVWNQYMYNVTNVNNDLTIPKYYYNNSTPLYDPDSGTVRRPYNNFLQQATSTDQYGRPFYTAVDISCDSATTLERNDSVIITIHYSNHGSNTLYSPYYITLYKNTLYGEVLNTYAIHDTVFTNNIKTKQIALSRSEICGNHADTYIISLNDAGSGIAQNGDQTTECDTTNNTTAITIDIPPAEHSTDTIKICNNYLWLANNKKYTNSCIDSSLTHCTRPAAAGCDSMLILALTIYPSVNNEETVIACDSYKWNITGEIFENNTRIKQEYTSIHGCDSTYTLNLEIHRTTYQEAIVEGCDKYYWPVDHRTYTKSIVHTEYMKSDFGCDSTWTLTLNMHYTYHEDIYDTLCEGDKRLFYSQECTQTGTYTYNGSTLKGCDSTVTLHLVVKPRLYPQFDSIADCEKRCITLRRHEMDSNIGLMWKEFPDNGTLDGHEWDTAITLSPTLSTVYSLMAYYKEELTCENSVSISLQAIQPVTASIEQSAECFTPDITSIRLTNIGQGATTYAWFTNGNYYSLMPSITCKMPNADSLRITLIAFNSRCSDTARTVLYVHNSAIYIPNTFTPSEEHNRIFQIKGQNIIEYYIQIYNRRGEIVYESKDIDDGWDGTHQNNACPMGAYVYHIKYRISLAPAEWHSKTGTVLLIR